MNVYFLPYNNINDSIWPYIIKILKIKKIYSFVPMRQIPDGELKRLLRENGISKRSATKANCEHIIYSIVENISNYNENGMLGDNDSYKDSSCLQTILNIKNTDDPNIAFIGKVVCRPEYRCGYSDWCFEDIIDTMEVEGNTRYRDVSLKVARGVRNMLKKRLGDDKYTQRISFYRFCSGNEELLIEKGFWMPPHPKGSQYKVDMHNWVSNYVKRQMKIQFPETCADGKRIAFWNEDIEEDIKADRDTEIANIEYRQRVAEERAASRAAAEWEDYMNRLDNEYMRGLLIEGGRWDLDD